MPLLKNGFTIGMPHMVPGQLSEVELIKFIGDFQWLAISKSLNVPTKDIVNEIGERLYASFINLDLDLGGRTFSSFKEGAHIRVKHQAQFFARRFAEGFFYFDDKEFPDAALEEVSTRGDLRQHPTPWIYLTNALVTRETSNLRLRTFAPSTEIPRAARARWARRPKAGSKHERYPVSRIPQCLLDRRYINRAIHLSHSS